MRMRGLEPPRPYGHGDLNAARLPNSATSACQGRDDIAPGEPQERERAAAQAELPLRDRARRSVPCFARLDHEQLDASVCGTRTPPSHVGNTVSNPVGGMRILGFVTRGWRLGVEESRMEL